MAKTINSIVRVPDSSLRWHTTSQCSAFTSDSLAILANILLPLNHKRENTTCPMHDRWIVASYRKDVGW